MIGVFIIPFLLSILPIEDANMKMHVGILLGELIARGYLKTALLRIFKYFQKRQIVIPDQTREMDYNPLFHKVQDYLALKFSKSIESCELVPKNGDVEFSLSDMSSKIFTDTCEINNVPHTFELSIEKINENPFDDRSKAMRQIVVKSRTATPDDIKFYVKKISSAQTKNTNLIKIFRPLIHGKKKDERTIEWDSVMVKTNKTLKNTIYATEIEEQLFNDIDRFMNNEQWYADRGIPYKRGYFLYSTPGQGKTSVAKILANKYGTPIFCLDLTTIDENAVLTKLMTEINYYACQERHILLIEDIDRTEFINPRYRDPRLSMDCFLNAIDGVAEPHGRIVIMSANEPEHVINNTALMRPGRIDKSIEFKSCNKDQIKKMYELFYAAHTYKVDWDAWTFNESLSAAYIVKLLQENIDHPEVFMRLVGEAKAGDDKDVVLDDTFKKVIENAKSEQAKANDVSKSKHKDNRYGGRRRRGQRYSNKIEDKIRRTKHAIKRAEQRVKTNTNVLQKSQTKLPLFLEKLKQKQEKERIKKLQAKAKRRTEFIRKTMQPDPEEYVEEEYETPAFLANSIALDDVIPGTTTTYELMEEELMEDEYNSKEGNIVSDTHKPALRKKQSERKDNLEPDDQEESEPDDQEESEPE